MAAPSLPAEIEKLRRELIVDQAPSSRARTEIFRPGRFVQRYGRPYSSRRLPISTLEEMRTDALLRFAQMISLVPIFTGKWRIQCANARKAQFIDHALRQIIGRLILQFFESWNFGFQALVKEFALVNPDWVFLDKEAEGGAKVVPVWDGGPEVPALIWQQFVPLSPRAVAPVWTPGGDFNGIALAQNGVGYGLPTVPFAQDDFIDILPELMASFINSDQQQRNKIDIDHALWVVNERDAQWASIWGRSRLAYAFKYWWSYEMTLGILNRSVERKGDPTVVVSYPQGKSMVNGVETDNQTIAMQIGESGRSGAVLAVPSEVWGEDMATANQASKWKIDYLKAEERFDELRAVLDYLDTMKIRSMMVAELTFAEGSGGTSSRNVARVVGERTSEAQILTQAEWDEIINAYMIPQLANANFPELADVPARKITQSFGEGESALAADILRSLANANPGELPLDVPALLERFQIDGLTGTDLEKWATRMATQAETNTKPPKTPATTETAGVTDTGFYVAGREEIVLEDDVLLASLPKSKHYSDNAVLAQTRLVRRLYKALLVAQYEDFAVHVARSDLSLAEDQADGAAARIVASWRYTGALLAKTIKAVALALSKVLARAGTLELSSSRIRTDAWKPDDSDLQQWARDNAGALVRDVDETTRKQLSTFLASELRAGHGGQEIATNLRAHFAEFPNWRADLIAREETKRYYNAGTLFAAQAVGSDQVQALDAQGPGATDEECVVSGTLVHVVDASRSHARYYEGYAISIATAGGEKLTVTPNHPVLTPDGWVAAGLLKQDDYVVCCPRPDLALRVAAPGRPDDHYEPLVVEQAAELPHVPFPHVAVGKATRGADFHGDGANSKIHVERTNRSLWKREHAAGGKQGRKPLFVRTIETSRGLLRESLSLELSLGLDSTARGNVGSSRSGTALLGGHASVLGATSSAGVAQDYAGVDEELADRERGTAVATAEGRGGHPLDVVPGDLVDGKVARSNAYRQTLVDQQLPDPGLRGMEMGGDLLDALAGEAEATQIVEVDRVWWQGHVYNFATSLGWYISGGIITHNCVARNGRVFSVADAWSESAREHVRGTLSWRIIPAEVQLSFVRRSREYMGDVAARIDQQERVVYLVEGMDPATEGRFLERAVEWLVRPA